jgi:hypothetical protein
MTNYYNTTGSNNTMIGYEAGAGSSSHSKSGNVFIGYQAGYNETGSNKLYIENSDGSSPLIGGDFSADEIYLNGDVGIGTTSPNSKLEVAGTVAMTGFTMTTSPSSGYVLTSDASGNGTWQAGGLLLPYSGSTSSSSDAFNITTTGTGRAGYFDIDNLSNSSTALRVVTAGSGHGGSFNIMHSTNSNDAVFALTYGSGNAVHGKTNSSTGRAGFFEINSATNTNDALYALTIGTGRAGYFKIDKSTNSAPALEVSNNGLGYGIYVTHTGSEDGIHVDISGGGSNRCAILAVSDRVDPAIAGIKTGVTGEGGSFEIDNTSNTGDALAGITNGTGAALKVDHYGDSGNIALFQNNHGTVASINKNGDAWFDGGMEVDGLTGTSSYNNVRVNTSTGQFYYETSSARYKDDIGVLNDDFSRILELEPKKYTDKVSGLREIGYIAEELDVLGLKDLVIYNNENKPNGLKYDRISLYLVEVLKQYRAEIESLKKEMEMIKGH